MRVLQILIVAIAFCNCNSEENDNAAEFLWQLSKYAVESRQSYKEYSPIYQQKYPEEYSPHYPYYQLESASYPQYQNTQEDTNEIYHQYLNYPYRRYPQKYQKKDSFIDILSSVVRNDDLECVPKILCEVTSGTMSGRQQGFNLPVNLNMESLLGFLTVLNGAKSSPILQFGKAALLGATSKGNSTSCNTAYPRCPSDPDKLVYYLNNHNGGFFRYFNGNNVNKRRPYRYAKKYHQQYRPTYQTYINPSDIKNYYPEYYDKKTKAEQRIQTNPINSIYSNNYVTNDYGTKGFRFPSNQYTPDFENHRNPKGISLTNNNYSPSSSSQDLFNRDPSGIFAFPNDYNSDIYGFKESEDTFGNDQLVFPKPLSDHKASPLIFPTRTGTGELILDAEELEDDYNKGAFVFKYRDHNQDNKYFVNTNTPNSNVRGGRGLVFPE